MKTTFRQQWLDNAKAIAIIFVVLGHALTIVESYKWGSLLCKWIYYFHMPLFITISGISFKLLSQSEPHKKNNIIKHTLNIILIYILQSVIYILTNILLGKYIAHNSIVTWSNMLSLLYKPVAHFWYLYALIIYYIFDLLLSKLICNPKVKIIIALAISFLSLIIPSQNFLSKIFYLFFYFELGRNYESRKTIIAHGAIIVFTALSLLCFLNHQYKCYSIVKYLFGITGSLTFLFICQHILKQKILPFTFLGQKSLWIYVFHSYFTAITRVLLIHLSINETFILFVSTFIGTTGPLLLYLIFKKLNLHPLIEKPIGLFK